MKEMTTLELRTVTSLELKELEEPTLLVSDAGPFGVRLAVLMPLHVYEEQIEVIERAARLVAELSSAVTRALESMRQKPS